MEKTGSEASGKGREGEGRETRAEAEGVGAGKGLERVTATTFSGPWTWTRELVNSARYKKWPCWQVDHREDTLNKT